MTSSRDFPRIPLIKGGIVRARNLSRSRDIKKSSRRQEEPRGHVLAKSRKRKASGTRSPKPARHLPEVVASVEGSWDAWPTPVLFDFLRCFTGNSDARRASASRAISGKLAVAAVSLSCSQKDGRGSCCAIGKHRGRVKASASAHGRRFNISVPTSRYDSTIVLHC